MNVMKTSLTIFPCVLGSAFPIIRVCSGLSFATKGLGHLATLYLLFVTCCSLQSILSQNYLLPLISVLAENTLLKTAYHFLLLLVGFDTLTYRKDYDRSPILVGNQDSFLAPLPGSVVPLVGGIWKGKIYIVCWNLLSFVTMESNPLRGLFGVSSPWPKEQTLLGKTLYTES